LLVRNPIHTSFSTSTIDTECLSGTASLGSCTSTTYNDDDDSRLAPPFPAMTLSKTDSETRSPEAQQRHLVLPTDTWAGLCLFYRVTSRALRKANPGCSTTSLPLYQWLVIPTTTNTTGTTPSSQRQCQNTNTDDFRQAFVKHHCPTLSINDIRE
jgi:hypothetical protein